MFSQEGPHREVETVGGTQVSPAFSKLPLISNIRARLILAGILAIQSLSACVNKEPAVQKEPVISTHPTWVKHLLDSPAIVTNLIGDPNLVRVAFTYLQLEEAAQRATRVPFEKNFDLLDPIRVATRMEQAKTSAEQWQLAEEAFSICISALGTIDDRGLFANILDKGVVTSRFIERYGGEDPREFLKRRSREIGCAKSMNFDGVFLPGDSRSIEYQVVNGNQAFGRIDIIDHIHWGPGADRVLLPAYGLQQLEVFRTLHREQYTDIFFELIYERIPADASDRKDRIAKYIKDFNLYDDKPCDLDALFPDGTPPAVNTVTAAQLDALGRLSGTIIYAYFNPVSLHPVLYPDPPKEKLRFNLELFNRGIWDRLCITPVDARLNSEEQKEATLLATYLLATREAHDMGEAISFLKTHRGSRIAMPYAFTHNFDTHDLPATLTPEETPDIYRRAFPELMVMAWDHSKSMLDRMLYLLRDQPERQYAAIAGMTARGWTIPGSLWKDINSDAGQHLALPHLTLPLPGSIMEVEKPEDVKEYMLRHTRPAVRAEVEAYLDERYGSRSPAPQKN
jgi:hypothetical protein